MVKGNPKSSATSSTRKKHAKRAATQNQVEDPEPLTKEKKAKGQDKRKKEPRQKVYIPPVKPAPPQPDPLDTTGLAHTLPAELLVVLRSIGKKAEVTKVRALEDLQTSWVDKCKNGEDESLANTLLDMLPVWLHHMPSLFLHSSRRIRATAAALHLSLLQIATIRDQILFFIHEEASPSQTENILGTWCIVAHDVDRMVSNVALKSWANANDISRGSFLRFEGELLAALVSFIEKAVLDPLGVYLYLNPPAPAAPPHPVAKKTGVGRPAPPTTRKETQQETRSRPGETEENEQDKKARIRCGALGAIRWLLGTNPESVKHITLLLSNTVLWSALSPAEACPFVSLHSFGYTQPAVRQFAWLLLQDILRQPKEHIRPLIPTLSRAVLRSAWIETDTIVHTTMWQPLLTFLKNYPSSWNLSCSKDADTEVDSESDSDTKHEFEPSEQLHKSIGCGASPAYREFLDFLRSGCGGSPLQGYPAVLVVISTIPINTLIEPEPPFCRLFASMWCALGDRVSTHFRPSAVLPTFLTSLIECVIFITKRLCSDPKAVEVMKAALSTESPAVLAKRIIEDQIGKIWDSLCNKRLGVEEKISTALLGNLLMSLVKIQEDLFTTAWDNIASAVKESKNSNSFFVATFLKTLRDQFSSKVTLEAPFILLIRDSVMQSVKDSRDDLANAESKLQPNSGLLFLTDMLDIFREELSTDPETIEAIDSLVNDYCLRILEYPHSLIQTYLAVRNDEERCTALWQMLLSAVLREPQKSLVLMGPILDGGLGGHLPFYLRPKASELDNLILQWMSEVVAGSPSDADLPIIEKVLRVPEFVLSKQGVTSVHHALFCTFNHQIESMLSKGAPAVNMGTLLRLFEIIPSVGCDDSCSEEFDFAASNMFVLGYLLPEYCYGEDPHIFLCAQKLWELWIRCSQGRRKDSIITKLKQRLKALIHTTNLRPMPEHIIKIASEHSSELNIDTISPLLPSPVEFDEMLARLPQPAIHPSLAVIDPLIPYVTGHIYEPPECDARGYSSYARAVCSLIWLLSENRRGAKHHIWTLKHVLSFTLYASDFRRYPAGASPLFSVQALNKFLDDLVTKATHITVYHLSLCYEDAWRQGYLDAALNGTALDDLNPASSFLAELVRDAVEGDSSRATRILKTALQHVLGDVDTDEADRWFTMAKQLEHSAPETFMAIISALVQCVPQTQRLDHYRNQLAASLVDVPGSQVNTEGLLALRKLASTSPSPETDVIFLPHHRTVNLVKALQKWMSSDEDIDEEVENAMMLVLVPLLPILQTIPGAHWEFIFDLIESNLENSDINDEMRLVPLARAMRLVNQIQDLAKTNRSFSDVWNARETPILTIVRDMAMIKLDPSGMSVPRSLCRELTVAIVQDLPASLIDPHFLPKMCHLLTDHSSYVQKTGYRFLNVAAKKRTEYLVMEASLNVDSGPKIELPEELIAILQYNFDGVDSEAWQEQSVHGYLLGWMLVFDSFQDASLKVRSGYIDQLRSLDLISKDFMPGILSLLELRQGIARAFKLDMWYFDEFYVELFDPEVPVGTPLLAAHLYYRALLTVPSLIHGWVLDCKDRQVSSTVTSYTSTHFSPVLIRAELARVKAAEAASDLVDETFRIKVVSSTNEVTAAYTVDEHELEIRLKVPSDWPLHKIEVKDVKRVGVDEHRWRAWILAIQQSIWSHNGRIADSLGLFKKNVTLHFDGQTECAICYSIISPIDGSLPRKPCKTCRNRFHAGCLYKWFNTSHLSTCPLCRSDII